MQRNATAALLGALVLSVSLAGCFGGPPPQEQEQLERPPELTETEQQRLEILAAPEIRNFTLPGSNVLPAAVQWFNGSLDTAANLGIQDRNMRGGNDFNVALTTFDITSMLPQGQPTALRIKLVYFGQPGSSAQAHIYVCVPGECGYYSTDNNDEFNWKATVQIHNVVTVGASGQPALVGVAAANGKMLSPVEFSLEVQATYFKDVLTPFNAYAFTVPEGATGVTLRSVKPGQEHLQANFVILDPNDELVTYIEYDDIAVVSESIFIPTRQPGEYVFYAQAMHNGFFSIVADAPLEPEQRPMRALQVQVTEGSLATGPAPGVVGRDFTGSALPVPVSTVDARSAGTKVAFSVDNGFPVDMGVVIGNGATGAAEVLITNAKGVVYMTQRLVRVDSDQGSLGYTRDEANTATNWANLAKGAYNADVTSNVVTGEITYWVKTVAR